MSRRINTIVIPAAGMGTRLLPATRVTAKEMLPVYDTPMIDFAMEEAAAAGAVRVIVVLGPWRSETICCHKWCRPTLAIGPLACAAQKVLRWSLPFRTSRWVWAMPLPARAL